MFLFILPAYFYFLANVVFKMVRNMLNVALDGPLHALSSNQGGFCRIRTCFDHFGGIRCLCFGFLRLEIFDRLQAK